MNIKFKHLIIPPNTNLEEFKILLQYLNGVTVFDNPKNRVCVDFGSHHFSEHLLLNYHSAQNIVAGFADNGEVVYLDVSWFPGVMTVRFKHGVVPPGTSTEKVIKALIQDRKGVTIDFEKYVMEVSSESNLFKNRFVYGWDKAQIIVAGYADNGEVVYLDHGILFSWGDE